MKSILLSSAAALVLTASQAHAAEPALSDVSAVLSIHGGGALLNSDDGQFDRSSYTAFGGDVRVAGKSWQLELAGGWIPRTDKDSGSNSDSRYLAAAGHWLNRGEDRTWGGFGGLARAKHQDSDGQSTHFFGGVEMASFSGNSTMFGQVGGINGISGDETDSWEYGGFARAGWRYFPTDKSKFELDATAGYGSFDSDNSNGWTGVWGAEYERQLSDQFSLFGAYRGHYVADIDNDHAISNAILVGLRFDLNPGTLRKRDKSGAGTFNIPDFHRALAWPNDL